jgi:hypothetical protein
MTDADLKTRLQSYFVDRAREHPAVLTEIHARSVERRIELPIDHFVLVCRLKMLWGWHIEEAPRKPYSQPLGVKTLYHLYTGGKRVVNHHGYPLIFGSLLEALTYDPVWATVDEALMLVPEGCEWKLTSNGFLPLNKMISCKFFDPTPLVDAYAATPATAILAARLAWEEGKHD